ncbi:LLM class F420-dependent oxidoreductase [Rhizorhabdus dicambivorans]|uniref:LLM class F420-dependent oxidoreductase n=1 Tax=Rhizorhabdus dicambivorans TaxID=1850238 RepID=A0A2A4FSK1_9SPHN|nr:LLM class F420-dependent oxidoreductase [Rhizorhabdus dicambivorans]ATE66204.1 LLM class F420-dependent oxidoreductase [Rhizorhabdus dicambivorans]PCE41715.1 LLM class F420-dependent oxidoreductase [Rhizorhabdus dicambivorans]
MGGNLGRIGIWTIELRLGDPGETAEAAAELDALGYGAIWMPGGIDDGVLHDVGRLLNATSRAVIATGIINIWKQPAADVAAWWAGQSAERQARTMLGLGISHGPLIEGYAKPVATMAAYLDGLDAAGMGPERRCLAALGPKMLDLARDRAAGAHPYLTTPAHSRIARERLGPGALLAPEQGVILETDPDKARAIGRAALERYRRLPNYVNSWLRLGYDEEDVKGSDRLVDALFLWGGMERIRAGVQAHLDAGADHVCLQVIRGDAFASKDLPREEWRQLAAALL